MRTLFYILLSFLSLKSFANNTKDSLIRIVFNPSELAENRINAIYASYKFYEHVNTDSCLILADLLNKLNTKKIDTIISDAEIMKAKAFYVLAQYDSAKFYCESAFLKELKIGRISKQAEALNGLSIVAEKHSDHEKSIKYATLALRLLQKTDDKIGVAQALYAIGNIHRKLNDNEQALTFFYKALEITKALNDKVGQTKCYGNIGNCYNMLKKYPEAMDAFGNALKINTEINDKRGLGTTYGNIGLVYMSKNEYQKSIFYFRKAIELANEINDLNQLSFHYMRMSKSFQELSKKDSALFYADKSIQINNTLKNPTGVMNTYRILKDVYAKSNDYKNAYLTLEDYVQLKDSIFNDEKVKSLQEIQTKYESEKQASEIKQLESDNKVQLLENKKENTQKIAFGVAFLFSFVLVIIALWSYNQKKKSNISLSLKNEIITKQKEEVEQQKEIVEKAHNQLEEKNKEILDSITYAKRIQSAILPPQKLVKEFLPESFILYKPKDIVAGDFYWMEHKNNKLLFAACDCTGHGVPGAMVSVVCVNGLNRSVREHGLTEPGEILDKTREIVIQEFEKSDEEVKDGMDISLCGMDFSNNTLTWAGANNPLWIIRPVSQSGIDSDSDSDYEIKNQASNYEYEIIEYKADKQPIGKYDESKPFTTHQIQLEKGNSIYIFTDGYQDQFGGEKGKKFKAAKLRELLLSIQHESMEKQRVLVNEAFEQWKGNLEQVDDVCIIGVRI